VKSILIGFKYLQTFVTLAIKLQARESVARPQTPAGPRHKNDAQLEIRPV
jgi:hypothetical protein